jgi:hypothetical protein
MPGRSGRLAVSWGLHWGSSRGVAAGRYDGGRRRGRRGGSGYRRGRRRGSRGQRSLRRGASWRLRGARGGRLRSDRAQRRVRSTDRFTGLWGLCRALRGFRHSWSRLVLGGLRQGDQRRIHPGPTQHAAHQQQDIAACWHGEHSPESADGAMAMPGRIHENRLPGGEGRHKRGILPVLEAPLHTTRKSKSDGVIASLLCVVRPLPIQVPPVRARSGNPPERYSSAGTDITRE